MTTHPTQLTDEERKLIEQLIPQQPHYAPALKRLLALCEEQGKRLEHAEVSVKLANDGSDSYWKAYKSLESQLTTLTQRHADAVEALEFYADPETYFAIGIFPDSPCGEFVDDIDDCGEHGFKPGKKAREALERLKKGEV